MDQEQLRILEQWSNQLRLTTDELQDFKDAVRVLGPAFAKAIDPLNKFGDEIKAANAATKNKTAAERDDARATSENTKAKQQNRHVTEALTDAQEELSESTDALKSAMGSAARGILGVTAKFGDALLSGTQGAGKYGDAVGKAGDAALEIGSKFGILGTIIGGLIKAGTVLVEMQLKQADEQRKAQVELSKLGASGQFTAKQMLELAHSANVPIARFNEFLGPLKSMGTAITSIGNSAKESTENFAKFSKVTEQERERYFQLGLSQADLTQSMADYITLQKASGRVIKQQEIDNGSLQKAALRYTLQMQELSDLTGLEIEQAKKKMQETTDTIQMAVIGFQREEKLRKLEESKVGKTGEELAQIERAIALHEKQGQSLENVNMAMAAIGAGGKEAGMAMQQFLETGSMSAEASRKFGQLGMDMDKYKKQYDEGNFDQAQFMTEYRDKIRKRLESTGTSILTMGAEEAEKLGKELGVSAEEIKWAQANATKDFVKATEDRAEQNENVLKGKVEDPMTKNLARMAEIETQSQIAKEKFIDSINVLNNDVVPEFTTAAEAMTKALEMVTAALKVLLAVTAIGAVAKGGAAVYKGYKGVKDWVGSKKPPGGPTTPKGTPPGTPPEAPKRNDAGQLVGKDGKPLKGAALKSAEEKAAKAAEKATEEAAKKASEEAAKKAAQEGAEAAGKAGAKTAAKTAGKAGLKSVLKKIPGIGALAGLGFGAQRAFAGDWSGAAMEVGSGLAGTIPGVGTAASLGLDAALAAKDMGAFKKDDPVETVKEQSQAAKEVIAEKNTEALEHLSEEIENTTKPLDSFGSSLDSAKKPVVDFAETVKKANNMLSRTALGGSGANIPASPFTTQFMRGGKLDPNLDISNKIGMMPEEFAKKFSDNLAAQDLAKQMGLEPKEFAKKFSDNLAAQDLAKQMGLEPEEFAKQFSANIPKIDAEKIFEQTGTMPAEFYEKFAQSAGLRPEEIAKQMGLDSAERHKIMKPSMSFGRMTPREMFEQSKPRMTTGSPPTQPQQQSKDKPAAPTATGAGGGFFSRVASMFGFGDSSAGAEYTGGTTADSDILDKKRKGGAGGMMSEQDIKNMIIDHEGVRYEPYKDSLGLWTVGVGHLIGDGRTLPPQYNRQFSHEEVMSMFDKDYEKHKKQAESVVPGFAKYDSMGQAAFIDLTFNMGPGWPKKFKNTSKKIEEGDTEGAAEGLENSLWYRQVGRRAPKIVDMVENSKVSAKDGGFASGPMSGYPATLHGNEIIVPLDPNSILAELGKKTTQEVSTQMETMQSNMSAMPKDINAIPDILRQNQVMIDMLSNKLDDMIKQLDTSNDTQTKLLRYTQ